MYNTDDLFLAATFTTLGFPLIQIDNLSPRVLMCFEQTPELESTINRYFNREILLDPLTLFDNYNFLKKRLFAIRSQQKP